MNHDKVTPVAVIQHGKVSLEPATTNLLSGALHTSRAVVSAVTRFGGSLMLAFVRNRLTNASRVSLFASIHDRDVELYASQTFTTNEGQPHVMSRLIINNNATVVQGTASGMVNEKAGTHLLDSLFLRPDIQGRLSGIPALRECFGYNENTTLAIPISNSNENKKAWAGLWNMAVATDRPVIAAAPCKRIWLDLAFYAPPQHSLEVKLAVTRDMEKYGGYEYARTGFRLEFLPESPAKLKYAWTHNANSNAGYVGRTHSDLYAEDVAHIVATLPQYLPASEIPWVLPWFGFDPNDDITAMLL